MLPVTADSYTELRRNGCRCVRECGAVGLLTGVLDTLPLSTGLWPHMTRTPTPPWAIGMEVAEPENDAAGVVVPERSAPSGKAPMVPRKAKRIRVQLDTRIELTDEELKVLQCFCHAHSVL
jgi:hypothetical protein